MWGRSHDLGGRPRFPAFLVDSKCDVMIGVCISGACGGGTLCDEAESLLY